MSSIKVILKKEKLNKRGEAPLYLRLIKDRKAKFISLSVYVNPKEWNEETMRVRKSHPNSQRVNNFIAQKVAEAEGIALEMESSTKYVNPKKIKEAIIGKSSESFFRYFEGYVAMLKQSGRMATHDSVEIVMMKLKRYMKGKDLSFDELTVLFIKNYETYLRTELQNSINTTHNNLQVIRRLVNSAVREDIFPFEKNPFLRYKLKTEKTEKIFLTEEELAAIESLPFEIGSRRYDHRNAYIFSAYSGGLRISDILQLRWEDFDGERLLKTTQKTGSTVSIKLPKRALEIIALYSKENNNPKAYIFPFFETDVDYSNPRILLDAITKYTNYINKDLKVIVKMAGIDKHVHFHTSRHTWATRALKKGMRLEYVSKLMGHSSIKTTQIYAKIVNEELDKAMMDAFD